MIPRPWLPALLLVLCGLCSACSSFDARWKAAANGGGERWDGRWTSAKHVTAGGSPEGGRLRAVTETGPNKTLIAHFHANWKIFATNYSVTLDPKKAGNRGAVAREFSGTQELPKMFGGTYHYEARLDGDRFDALYHSSYDHGTFALQKVQNAKDYDPAHARH